MPSPKGNDKPKTTRRKSVAQAIASQDKESQKSFSLNSEDIQNAIRVKAYELYLERGGASSDPTEDWLAAEQMVLKTLR